MEPIKDIQKEHKQERENFIEEEEKAHEKEKKRMEREIISILVSIGVWVMEQVDEMSYVNGLRLTHTFINNWTTYKQIKEKYMPRSEYTVRY